MPREDVLRAERDAARGAIDSIMEAIKGDRFTDGLQSAEFYVRYTLGTAGHLYHVEGYMDMCRERDEARAQADALAQALDELLIGGADAVSMEHAKRAAKVVLRSYRKARDA